MEARCFLFLHFHYQMVLLTLRKEKMTSIFGWLHQQNARCTPLTQETFYWRLHWIASSRTISLWKHSSSKKVHSTCSLWLRTFHLPSTWTDSGQLGLSFVWLLQTRLVQGTLSKLQILIGSLTSSGVSPLSTIFVGWASLQTSTLAFKKWCFESRLTTLECYCLEFGQDLRKKGFGST